MSHSFACALNLSKRKHVATPEQSKTGSTSCALNRKSLAFEKRQNIDLLRKDENSDGDIEMNYEESDDHEQLSEQAGTTNQKKNIEIQCDIVPQVSHVGCQCDIITVSGLNNDSIEDQMSQESSSTATFQNEHDSDPDWEPENENDNDLDEWDEELRSDRTVQEDRKFIVFESCLLALLSVCCICTLPCRAFVRYVKGTFIVVDQICSNGHRKAWASQPLHGNLPQGNLQLASAIMFSGSSATKCITMFKHMNLLTFASRTFNAIQSHYLIPAIFHVWHKEQKVILDEIKSSNESVVLGGDGRCDSPGHTAKYGSYTLVDLQRNKVIEMQLIQSNEVQNSNAMELEGLKRCFATLDEKNIPVKSITTDRHKGVQKYMREQRGSIKHYYDVWHMAKAIYRKLLTLAKKKGFGIVKDWAKSISNHLYWCASSSNGDSELVKQKWMSVANHVANVHEGHGDRFPRCLHEHLNDRAWIIQGSRQHKRVQIMVNNKTFVRDIGKLSPTEQTACIEAFHSIVNYFAPKMIHYFYSSMKARVLLACLHYNENSQRAQARSADGQLLWTVTYPKYKEGGTVHEVKTAATFDYVQELNSAVQLLRDQNPTYRLAAYLIEQYKIAVPDSLASTAMRENKDDLILKHSTRFPNKYKYK